MSRRPSNHPPAARRHRPPVVATVGGDQAAVAPAAALPVYDWEAANQRKIDAVRQLVPLADALDELELRIAALVVRANQVDWELLALQ